MSGTAHRLADRWPLPDLTATRDALLAAYADPGRRYHDTRHLTEVLDRLDELAAAGEAFDRVPVVLAAWFHDGVYAGQPDDEERSARWAEEALKGRDEAAEVARLVRVTTSHRPGHGDGNGAALCDADLAILAAPPERHAEYVAAVRQEYSHVPDDAFAAGRAAVAEDLLDRPRLFHTTHGHQHWEPVARANLAREVEQWRSGSGAGRFPAAEAGGDETRDQLP